MGTAVEITKLDHTGRVLLTYWGELVRASTDEVVVRCHWTRPQAVTVGFLTFTTGDILVEYFYRLEWFNIFKLYASGGQLKGWYCNLAEPDTFSESTIRWRDLALDLLVSLDGEQRLVDQDEFEEMQPSAELRRAACEAFSTLRRWVAESHPPFEFDVLAQPGRPVISS